MLTTVVVTVALSVVLHGLTSAPLVTAYHRWYAAHTRANPEAEEATPATMPRRRRQLDAAGSERLGGRSRQTERPRLTGSASASAAGPREPRTPARPSRAFLAPAARP